MGRAEERRYEGSSYTKGDYQRDRRSAAENERLERLHYEDEMRAEGRDPATGGRSSPSWYDRANSRAGKIVSSGPGGTAAGVVLGAFCYFLGLAYIRGGRAGASAWLKAKFVNKTTSEPDAVPASAQYQAATPASPSPPSTTTTTIVVPASQGQPSMVLA